MAPAIPQARPRQLLEARIGGREQRVARVRITRLNNKRLANGTRITITVSKAGRLTTTVTDRVSRGRRIEGRPRCTPVGC